MIIKENKSALKIKALFDMKNSEDHVFGVFCVTYFQEAG